MPILYLFALIALGTTYFWEKTLLHYFYQLPATYDGKISKQAINLLPAASLISLSFSYWGLGNREMFYNDVREVQFVGETIRTNHGFFGSGSFGEVVVLLCFIGFILSLIVVPKVLPKLKKCRENKNKVYNI